MMQHSKYLGLLICILTSSVAFGQELLDIGNDYQRLSFEAFSNKLRAEEGYKFYYDPASTDSLVVSLTPGQKSIYSILEEVLEGSTLHFGVTENKEVFITATRPIFTELPVDFFNDGLDRRKNSGAATYADFLATEDVAKSSQSKAIFIGGQTNDPSKTATITGTLRDRKTGEPLIGASVMVLNPVIGSTTDQSGYFSLTLEKGPHELQIQSVGMKTLKQKVILRSNGKLNLELEEDILPLKEVVIESEGDALIRNVQIGVAKLDIKTMKQIPLALGETDILKVVLTLPGVQSVGEGTVGINVRGGANNQNLILLNNAVVYNPSHLFGFFSTFNPDVLKNVELYKSGIGAEYGGRLSSVLDVHTRDGNLRKISGSGGISPITGRLSLEGPIIKDKTSFIIGARSTYSNWLLRQLDDPALQKSKASFYDLTGNITHTINQNNTLNLSGYTSQDEFNLASDTTYRFSDRNAVVKWRHIFNPKFTADLIGSFSRYGYSMETRKNPVNLFSLDFGLQQVNVKADFHYFPNPKHTFQWGVDVTRYEISPGTYKPKGTESIIKPKILASEFGRESAIYLSDSYDLSERISIYAGLRYSFYQFLGPKDVYQYEPNAPREPSTTLDTLSYGKGKSINSYHGAEPRASIRYSVSKKASVKFSYNRLRQYIQMLSNTAAATPTDIWKLSDPHIRPQVGDQIAIGYYQYFKGNVIEASVEAYYKNMTHMIDFKNGAQLFLNDQIETDVVDAKGKAYGVELLVKKSTGKVNGWVSYTFSRTFLQTSTAYESETVNDGKYYPANYDKPHAVNFIGNYKFNRRFNFSLNLIYSTGRPITLPIAKFDADGTTRLLYSDRNQYRIPDYFRSDVSINVEGNHKIKKLAHSSWTFAIYNVTGRKNPFSVYFVSNGGQVSGYKLSVFARPIPTITYNFKF
jgi:hypothetical protein